MDNKYYRELYEEAMDDVYELKRTVAELQRELEKVRLERDLHVHMYNTEKEISDKRADKIQELSRRLNPDGQ